MSDNRKCKECEYCKCHGRQNAKFSSTGKSRKIYYCEHKNVHECTENDFVGFGDTTWDSPLQLKTIKKWCPMKGIHKEKI